VDKTRNAETFTESSNSIAIASETDRIYQNVDPKSPVIVNDGGSPRFSVQRDGLNDVVVWNPWSEKAAGMSDFSPKDGYKNMSKFQNRSFEVLHSPTDVFPQSALRPDRWQHGRNLRPVIPSRLAR